MQRRTNLFYRSGQDSNFITFGNYTESLTGSFISTDWKLFPSKFICINVEGLTKERKEEFIKHIASYYENKLAFIRDWCISNNYKIEQYTLPFEWLLEEFDLFFGENTEERTNWEITFISEIVEQNFNGVYADTICTINGTDLPRLYSLVKNHEADTTDTRIKYEYSDEYLYGWYRDNDSGREYVGPSDYVDVNPNFDIRTIEGNWYSRFPKYESIKIDPTQKTSIDFNIIIPLFDLTNLNTKTNVNVIDENIDLTSQVADNDTEDKINIPLGIWFADTTVSLNRDGNTGYAPSWSLVLSSQFKPFPYSNYLNVDNGETYSEGAYVTFAQILARQNEMITNFSQLSAQIAKLSSKIEAVDAKINQMGTSYAIDGIHKEMVLFKNQITNLLEQYGVSSDTSLTWDAKFNG